MANIKLYVGGILFPGIFQKTGLSPLDDRQVVLSYDDLLNPKTWLVNEDADGDPNWYVGMVVSVIDKSSLYILTGEPTDPGNWTKIGDATGDITTINDRIDNVIKDIQNINSSVDDISNRMNATNMVLDGVSGRLDDMDNKILRIDTELCDVSSRTSILIKNINDYIIIIDSSINNISTRINETFININSSINDISNHLSNTDTSLSNVSTRLHDTVIDINSSINDISNHLSNTDTSLSNVSTRLHDAIVDINSSINDISVHLSNTDTSLSNVSTRLHDMVVDINSSINDISNHLGNTDASLSNVSTRLHDTVIDINISINDISTHLSNTDTSLSNVSTRLHDTVVDINSSINDISTHLSNTDTSLSNVSTRLNTTIINIGKSMVDVSNYMSKINSSISSISDKVASIDNSINAISNDVDSSLDALYTRDNELYEYIKRLLLINEIDSYVIYNENNNSITTNKSFEVGSTVALSDFTCNCATVLYGYLINGSESTGSWVVNSSNMIESAGSTALFDSTDMFETTFTYTAPTETLYTNVMNIGSNLLSNLSKTVKYSVKGYYNCVYVIGPTSGSTLGSDSSNISTTFSNITNLTSSNTNKIYKSNIGSKIGIGSWSAGSLTNSSFIYIAVPTTLTISNAYIRNGLSGVEELLPAPAKLNDTEYTFSNLSGHYTYNIWYVQKSKSNADNTVTANTEPIRIVYAIKTT